MGRYKITAACYLWSVLESPRMDDLSALANNHMSVLLVAKIILLIQQSGATQVEGFGALAAARELLPTIGLSHITPRSNST